MSNIGVGEVLGYLATAVVLFISYSIYNKMVIPRQLRHLPVVPFSKIAPTLFYREGYDITERKIFRPVYEKHGLAVASRNGHWSVLIANPQYAKQFLMRLETFPKMNTFPEDQNHRLANRFIGGDSIVFLNGSDWKRHRKIANPAFHHSLPVKLFGTLGQELFKQFEIEGNHVNVTNYMQRYTLDIIGMGGFGFNFNSIQNSDNPWTVMYNDVMMGLSNPWFSLFPSMDKYLWAFQARRRQHKNCDKLDKLFHDVIESKRSLLRQEGYNSFGDDDNEKDLLTMMLEANLTDKENGLSDKELRDNLAVFFIAGHDTTANALCTSIYFLAANKNIQQKAREEAIAILGDEPQDILPDLEQTKRFQYLNQIIKESLRMYPPASTVANRLTTADVDLGEHHIPKGSIVSLDIYAMHHSPLNWTNPDCFDPERFSEGGENEAKMGSGNGASYAWIPFSNGARQCIGMNFSLAEQRVLLSMLLRKYEWSLPADSIHKEGLKLDPQHIILTPMDMFIDFHPRY